MPSLHRTPPKKNKQREKLRRSSSRDGRSRRSDEHAARPTQTPGVDEVARPWEQTREVVQVSHSRLPKSTAPADNQPTTPPEWAQQVSLPDAPLNALISAVEPHDRVRGSTRGRECSRVFST